MYTRDLVEQLLRETVDTINKVFGENYAIKNPHLVAEIVHIKADLYTNEATYDNDQVD